MAQYSSSHFTVFYGGHLLIGHFFYLLELILCLEGVIHTKC